MPAEAAYGRRRRRPDALCPLCGRAVRLTFHHLIPKKLHRRRHFRSRYTRRELSNGIMICRLCHDGIHDLYDEMSLGRNFRTLAALAEDEALRRHFDWVAKQRTR